MKTARRDERAGVRIPHAPTAADGKQNRHCNKKCQCAAGQPTIHQIFRDSGIGKRSRWFGVVVFYDTPNPDRRINVVTMCGGSNPSLATRCKLPQEKNTANGDCVCAVRKRHAE